MYSDTVSLIYSTIRMILEKYFNSNKLGFKQQNWATDSFLNSTSKESRLLASGGYKEMLSIFVDQ